jgi:hypothetical protein
MSVHAPDARSTRTLCASLVVAALAACGGGGGDTAAPTVAPAPAATPITTANADAAAARGYEIANALFDASSAASQQLKAGTGANRLDLVRFSLAQIRSLAAGQGGVGPSAKGAALTVKGTSTDSLACPSGGSITVTVTDLNNNGAADAGDSASITFNACVADGVVASGSMGFVFVSYASGAAADSTSVTVTFDALRIVEGSNVSSATGDMTLAATISNVSPFTTDVTLSGSTLVLVDGAENRTLAGYSGRLLIDETRRTYSYAVAGAVSGSGLPGTLTLSTPTPIAGPLAGNPTTGQIVVTGASSSQVTLTASPPTGVELALDANGDGMPESGRVLTWAQFDAL